MNPIEGAATNGAAVVRDLLMREARLSAEKAEQTATATREGVWRAALAAPEIPDLDAHVRRAGLRAAAEALRSHEGGVAAEPTEVQEIPAGLTPEALRGALQEVIPGRRSVAGLYLRGYCAGEMCLLYDLDLDTMEDRVTQSLDALRSSLHRRAERMSQEGWSRGMEAQPIREISGMLRERPSPPGNRLGCPSPEDMAEAVNGTHFRGGREGALDHAIVCDPCAGELRVLLALRGESFADAGLSVGSAAMNEVRRAARSLPDLKRLLTAVPRPRKARRRIWPWLLLAAAAVAALWLL